MTNTESSRRPDVNDSVKGAPVTRQFLLMMAGPTSQSLLSGEVPNPHNVVALQKSLRRAHFGVLTAVLDGVMESNHSAAALVAAGALLELRVRAERVVLDELAIMTHGGDAG